MASSIGDLSRSELSNIVQRFCILQENGEVYVFRRSKGFFHIDRGLSEQLGGSYPTLRYLKALPKEFTNITIINVIAEQIFTQSRKVFDDCQRDDFLKTCVTFDESCTMPGIYFTEYMRLIEEDLSRKPSTSSDREICHIF